jgi:hypothetical protein
MAWLGFYFQSFSFSFFDLKNNGSNKNDGSTRR